MRSPFPGMDPYLEARWPNVRTTLIAAVQETLQPILPKELRARAEARVLPEIDGDEGGPRRYRSDVAVCETPRRATPPPAAPSDVATVDPVIIAFHDDQEVQRWVQIIDTADGDRVVTAIEILSPGNKAPGRLNAAYCRKLSDYQRGGVSVVEIDLLREPTRARLTVRTEDLPALRRSPYLACVWRAWQPDQWAAYPLALRQRLPRIPIPLRPTDAEVVLDLQHQLERAYAAGGRDDIDYTRPPEPPLAAEDAAWARQLVATR